MTEKRPLVSICIPTFEGAPWIRDTIGSALAQDYPSLEVVVSDDASTDGTVEIATSIVDPRIRVLRSPRRGGIAANWNRSIRAARGEHVKLLMQDDLLERDCVSRMVALLDAHPTIGLVFSPRVILLDDPSDQEGQRWRDRFGSLHDRLEPLGERNDGRRLYDAMIRDRFRLNCFGEPTAVMVRRTALEQVGLFAGPMCQLLDEEMWLRLAYDFDVGFVRVPLATIRFHAASASNRNRRAGTAWLERLWLLEGLRQDPRLKRTIAPRTEFLIWAGTIRAEYRRVRIMGWPGLGTYARLLRDYLRFRLSRRRPAMHEALGEPEL